MKMSERMRSILSRVLSTEIGNQQIWKRKDMENGYVGIPRDEIIEEIKDFMEDNNITINYDYIINAKG